MEGRAGTRCYDSLFCVYGLFLSDSNDYVLAPRDCSYCIFSCSGRGLRLRLCSAAQGSLRSPLPRRSGSLPSLPLSHWITRFLHHFLALNNTTPII